MSKPKLSLLKQELNETKTALKRALADYDNLDKRIAQERQLMEKLILVKVVLRFLPILDTLDKASKHTQDDGVLMVVRQFRQVLESEGIRQIGTVGDKFDPKFHETVEIVAGDVDDLIVEVITPGFAIDGQVVRPAKVKVQKTKVDKTAKGKAGKAQNFGDYA